MCIYQFSPDAHFPVAIKCPNGVTVLHLELFLVHFVDPPSTQNVATSAVKSWIGQMVTLKWRSDGVSVPKLAWYKPNGREINGVRVRENKVQVKFRDDQDLGDYKCIATNGLSPYVESIIKIAQISKIQLLLHFPGDENLKLLKFQYHFLKPELMSYCCDLGNEKIQTFLNQHNTVIIYKSSLIKSVNGT